MADRDSSSSPASTAAAAVADGVPGQAPLLQVRNMAKAFGPTQALRDSTFELRAGEVHRPGRRERLGQEHAGQDPQRRPRPRRRRAGDRRRGRLADPHPQLAQRARHRHRLPGGARRGGALGPRQRLARLRRPGPHAASPMREKRAARGRGARASCSGTRSTSTSAVEDLSLSGPAGLRHRPRPAARPADPDPRRGDLGARRRHARPPLRDRRRALAAEGVGVIFITHRMDEIEEHRRPHHRDALGRDGGDPRPRPVEPRPGRPPDDRRRALTERRARGSSSPRRGATRRAVLSVRGLRLRPDGAPIELEIAPRRAGRPRRPGGPRPAHLPGRAAGRRRCRRRGRCGTRRRREVADPLARRGGATTTSPTSRASAASTSLFRWMSIRENFAMPTLARDTAVRLAAHAPPRAAAWPATWSASASSSVARATRSRPSAAATSRR